MRVSDLIVPGPVRVKLFSTRFPSEEPVDGELLGYLENVDGCEYIAVVKIPSMLFLQGVHPSRVRPR